MTTIKDTARLALPLMLSSLSSTLMITVDRIMLASYDAMAMNAIAAIGILIFMLERGVGTITGMSEVLSGQLNGAKNYSRVASPVWQMLFFHTVSDAFFYIYRPLCRAIRNPPGIP